VKQRDNPPKKQKNKKIPDGRTPIPFLQQEGQHVSVYYTGGREKREGKKKK